MPQIEFKNVTKEYEQKALNNITLSIEIGEFIFLVGKSGAGKSTLIRMLIREEMPNIGVILFNNQDISEIPRKQLPDLRRKVGVVFQDFKLLDSKTVFENVAVALDVVDSPQEIIDTVVPNVLGMVGLKEAIYKFPWQLSGGERQRVSIARALAHEPDVLVLDEPTGMIDPSAAEEIIAILEKINSLGTTIIMATHDHEVVNKLKKRVVRLEKGSVISDKKGGKYHE